jgi:hypothetical protein
MGGSYLIFTERTWGCHPGDKEDGPPSGTHYISFYCDDSENTVANLWARGVEFTDEISYVGYGLAILQVRLSRYQAATEAVVLALRCFFKTSKCDTKRH